MILSNILVSFRYLLTRSGLSTVRETCQVFETWQVLWWHLESNMELDCKCDRKMRTDEQINRCIDALFARIHELETEVAALKGSPVRESVAPSLPKNVQLESAPAERAVNIPLESSGGRSIENAIGTRWIGRIGVLAILFGVAFFLKYSFDNKLIGETGRVMLGIFWGAAFISAGEYLQKKRDMSLYGQMLSGGGLGTLYLSIYGAFALYHLIPAPLAMGALVVTTTTGMLLSIRYNSYSLAALALLGGFLTPIMLSTGKNQPLALFSYILLLDAGVFLLLSFRNWPTLAAASLAGTALLYTGWHFDYFTAGERTTPFAIIAIFYLFYTSYSLLTRIYSEREETRSDQSVIFGASSFFLLAFIAQQTPHTWTLRFGVIIMAAAVLLFAEILRRLKPKAQLSIASFSGVSVIITVIAPFVSLDHKWTEPALAAEMAVFFGMGLYLSRPWLRKSSCIIGILVLLSFADEITLHLEPFQRFTPIFNSRFFISAVSIAAFYAIAKMASQKRDYLDRNEIHIPAISFIIAQLLSLTLLSSEVHDFFRFRAPALDLDWTARHYGYQLSLSILWALYASILTGFGIALRVKGARILGILLLGITILKVFFIDLGSLQTLYRIISFIVLGLLLLAVSYSYNRFRNLIFGDERDA